MKKTNRLVILGCYCLLACHTPPSTQAWSMRTLATVALTLYGATRHTQVEGQSTSFYKTLGTSSADYGYDIKVAGDGTAFVVGHTQGYGGGREIFLTKYDATGSVDWSEILVGPNIGRTNDYGRAFSLTSDGGAVFTGYSNGFDAGNDYEAFMGKVNATGGLEWLNALGDSSSHDYGYDIVVASDGSLFMAGTTKGYSAPSGRYDVLLVKTDGAGVLSWIRTLSGSNHEYARGITMVSDGGVVLTGSTRTYGGSTYNVFLTKFDAAGTHQWTKTLSGDDSEVGYGVMEATDGSLYVTGYTESEGAGRDDILLAKYDASGTLLWARAVGDTQNDVGYRVAETSDGGVALVGSYYDTIQYGYSAIVVKFNATGTFQWAKLVAGSSVESGFGIAVKSNGDILITGYTTSAGQGSNDLIIALLDGSGGADCGVSVTPTVTDVTLLLTAANESPTINSPTDTVTSVSAPVSVKTPVASTVCEDTSSPSTSPTKSPSKSPTTSPTAATSQPSKSPSTSPTKSPSKNPTTSPTAATSQPSKSPSTSPSKSPSKSPTTSPTAATSQPSKSPSSSPTKSPSKSPTTSPTAATSQPSLSPSSSPSQSPSKSPTTSPTAATSQPSKSPSTSPSESPSKNPSISPTAATSQPSENPTTSPTALPTKSPNTAPTAATAQPSLSPSSSPTKSPSQSPTTSPTAATSQPSKSPSTSPSQSPSKSPTTSPTAATSQPSLSPSTSPSESPSKNPSVSPTEATSQPSKHPTTSPTALPTKSPNTAPTAATVQPSLSPSRSPSQSPSKSPTTSPTAATSQPSLSPSTSPSKSPSQSPTTSPTAATSQPSKSPSTSPSKFPSKNPSISPTAATAQPSLRPSSSPTKSPSKSPTTSPTAPPTNSPNTAPTTATAQPSQPPSTPPTLAPSELPTIGQSLPNPTSGPTQDTPIPTLLFTTSTTSWVAPSFEPTNRPSTLVPTASPFPLPIIGSSPTAVGLTSSPNEAAAQESVVQLLKGELKTDETGVWALFGSTLFVVVVITGCLIKFVVKRCKKTPNNTQEEAAHDISREENIELAETHQNDLFSLFKDEKNNITLLTVEGGDGLNEEEYVE